MLIHMPCPCGQSLQVPSDLAGQRCECPVCHQHVDVPRMGVLARPAARTSPALPAPSAPQPPRTARSWPWLAAAGAVLVLAAGAVFSGGQLLGMRTPAPAPEDDQPDIAVIQDGGQGQGGGDGLWQRDEEARKEREYAWHLQLGNRSLTGQRYEEAIAHFRDAEKIKHTAEVVACLRQAEEGLERERALARAEQERRDKEEQDRRQAALAEEEARKERERQKTLEQLRAENDQARTQDQAVTRTLKDLKADLTKTDREAEAVARELDKLRKDLPALSVSAARDRVRQEEQRLSFAAVFHDGLGSLAEGDYDRAVTRLTMAVALRPNDGAARSALKEAQQGQARLRQDVQKALADGRKAMIVGDLPAAARAYKTAAQLAPRDARVHEAVDNLRQVVEARERRDAKLQNVATETHFRPLTDRGPTLTGPLRFDHTYQELLDITVRTNREQRLLLDEWDERTRAGSARQNSDLLAQDERIRANVALQKGFTQAQDARISLGSSKQNEALLAQDDRIRAGQVKQNAVLLAQDERIRGALATQKGFTQAQNERILTGAAKQNEGLAAQQDRVFAALAKQNEARQEQGDRVLAGAALQKGFAQAQGDRVLAGVAKENEVRQAQGDRVQQALAAQKGFTQAQNERILTGAAKQNEGLRTETDRVAATSAKFTDAVQAQDERTRAGSSRQSELMRAQDERLNTAVAKSLVKDGDAPPRSAPPPAATKPRPEPEPAESPEERQRRLDERAKRFADDQDKARQERELKKLQDQKTQREQNLKELQQLQDKKAERERAARELKHLQEEMERLQRDIQQKKGPSVPDKDRKDR